MVTMLRYFLCFFFPVWVKYDNVKGEVKVDVHLKSIAKLATFHQIYIFIVARRDENVQKERKGDEDSKFSSTIMVLDPDY
jgi:hypothetical protein